MNIKRQRLIIDIINIVMSFIPAYLLITILLYYFDSQSALHTLLLLPAPVISYLIRKRTHYIWSFLIFHGIMLAIFLVLVTNIYFITATVIYLVILTAVAYYKRNKINEFENTSSLLLIPIVLLYIACYLTGLTDLQQLCFYLSIVYALLYIVNMYLRNLEKFVYNHDGMTNIPFRQIRNSNNVIVVFLVSLFLFVMFVFSLLPLDRLLISLSKLFIRFLRLLISLIKFGEPEEMPEPEEEDIIIEDYPISEPSRLMEVISQILQWVATILAIVFVFAVILYTLYQIYQYFYLKSEETLKDKVEFLSPFVQRERSRRARRKMYHDFFGRSNNALIRKYFTNAVTDNLAPEIKLDKSLTPSQLSDYIVKEPIEAPEDIQDKKKQITKYYEKARYSNEACSKEEVQFLKKLLKRLS